MLSILLLLNYFKYYNTIYFWVFHTVFSFHGFQITVRFNLPLLFRVTGSILLIDLVPLS